MSELHAKKTRSKRMRRQRAHLRIRQTLSGTPERPRLSVKKSLRFIYAQLIDDLNGRTLAQANSGEKDLAADVEGAGSRCEAAKAVGEAVAERAKAEGITSVVFDRGGAIYHGKVKAVADGARSKGLVF